MTAAGGGNGTTGGGNNTNNSNAKSITITDITGKDGKQVQFGVISNISENEYAANGKVGTISDGSVKLDFSLAGKGEYHLSVEIFDNINSNETYYYSSGKTLVELSITGFADVLNLPKYDIKDINSIIPFNQFVDVSHFYE
jgi:hypothetical protein